MKYFIPQLSTSLCALVFACGCGCTLSQVLEPKRQATSSDYVNKLPAEKMSAMVLITGDKGSGTGFFAKLKEEVFLLTNMHVVVGQTAIKAQTMEGTDVQITGILSARDADIALLKLAEVPKAYFETEGSVLAACKTGDPILVPGNSLGGGTILQTEGKIVGLGPFKIEHSAPTFHGNSGSPILSTTSWKVLGVDTESVTVTLSDKSDAASAKDVSSQIKSSVRLFGYRLDSVAQWEAIEWAQLAQQSKRLETANAFVSAVHALLRHDPDEWKKHPLVNAAINRLYDVPDIESSLYALVINLRTSLKKVESDALESKRTCYGYISQRYQNLGEYARALREIIDVDKIR